MNRNSTIAHPKLQSSRFFEPIVNQHLDNFPRFNVTSLGNEIELVEQIFGNFDSRANGIAQVVYIVIWALIMSLPGE